MRNQIKKLAGVILALCIPLMVFAEQAGVTFFNQEDEGCALSVRYIGTSANATLVCTTQTIAVADGTITNTISLTNTMAFTLGNLMDCTNSAGTRNFEFDYYASLSTDSLSNKLLAGVATVDLTDHKWHRVAKIDTSFSKTYDVARDGDSAITLTGINGNIGGTGNVTVDVYVNGNKMWEYVEDSPKYTTLDGTVFSTNALVSIDKTLNMYVGKGQRLHIRAARATTATTGGIGAVFTQR